MRSIILLSLLPTSSTLSSLKKHVLKTTKRIFFCFGMVLFCFEYMPVHGQIKVANTKSISIATIDKVIKHQMDSLKIPGASIAVISNGKIVYEGTYGLTNIDSGKQVNKQTVFEAASMSKAVFAYFVMKLIQDGKVKLNLDQPVYEYFPYPDIAYDERYKLITARMLLTHTSGFPNWRANGKLTINFTPGTQYSYSGEAYEYLAMAIGGLTHTDRKTNLDSLLGVEVYKPLRLEHFGFSRNTYLTQHKAYGYYGGTDNRNGKFKEASQWVHPAYGLHTDADNYALFLIDLMKGKVLKKNYVDSLLKPRVRIVENGVPSDQWYGYGFASDTTKYGIRYQHTGDNGNFTGGFTFFRDKKLGFVVFTNSNKGILLHSKLTDLFTEGNDQ